MLKLTVNGIPVCFFSREEVNRNSHIKHWESPDDTHFKIPPDIYVLVSNGYDSTRMFLDLAGHDASKIDYAVPQDWFDEFMKKTGNPPRACWSYEKDSIFGEPLFWESIMYEVKQNVRKTFEEWIAERVHKEHLLPGG